MTQLALHGVTEIKIKPICHKAIANGHDFHSVELTFVDKAGAETIITVYGANTTKGISITHWQFGTGPQELTA